MIKNPRDVGRESAWRIGKIYYHTRESGIWVAPRHPKSLEGRTPAAIAAKAIRLLKKQNLKYLGTVDKVAVDDAPSARKTRNRTVTISDGRTRMRFIECSLPIQV